ncbi:carboxylating nicotinate-nucleotide diphosphorylase [Nakamurella endophytica]|uniref:Nicotinate-nucleotide pyrophosphorylase [carboxylating] n=1 Tax=Nakamurella endophytica TaxID=1748367 RepID=A0A917T6L3_9ACTN|nr:carboxylating nicotinate-nucleotide diphosphorylase [Nakamurella endophytica]GGM12365.1 nicotinate-nucleotide diphosphorylase (carboxylating) [Nakamurella endophytica]
MSAALPVVDPARWSPATVAAVRDAGLDADAVAAVVRSALSEDLADGPDVTTLATVPAQARGRARLTPRTPGVLAGVPVALAVLDTLLGADLVVEQAAPDGTAMTAGEPVLVVRGPVRGLLTAERTALNLLGHLSGIATTTRRWVDAVAGTGARIRDTRKTLPGLRALEKYAVRCGGGVNHRMSLGDAALIKDNHVEAAGSVTAAIAAVRSGAPGVDTEVEVDTLEQFDEAVGCGAELVLLDNFSLTDTAEAVRRRDAAHSGVRLESSGGLTVDRAHEVAATGVDFLAVGALTHSSPVLDLGMELERAAG